MKPEDKVKCQHCRRKVSIYAMKCKCENVYCMQHLTNHACSFDYKTAFREKLERDLPKVDFQKITKI